MKKGKIKTWMILLSILTILIIPISRAKAKVYSDYIITPSSSIHDIVQIDISNQSRTYNFGRTIFTNKGTGEIVFTIAQGPIEGTNNVAFNFELGGDITSYTCTSGNSTWYVNNTEQRIMQTITCPYNSDYNNGAKWLRITRDANYGTTRIYLPIMFTFVTEEEATINNNVNVNQQEVVNAINQSQQATINAMNNQTNAINTQTQHEDTNYNEFKNQDISETDKQQPNQDNYDTYEEKEQNVYDNLDKQDPNLLIDMAIDTETNNWIWNLITSIKGTHIRIQMLMITMLSLGLCKFILGR